MKPSTQDQTDRIMSLSIRVFGATCDGTQLQALLCEVTQGKRFLYQLTEAEAQEVEARLRGELKGTK